MTRPLPRPEIGRSLLLLLLAVGLLLLAAARPLAAVAKGGRPVEVRAAGVCGTGASSTLRLRGGGDRIDARFEVEHSRPGEVWRFVLVHERRVSWKGPARTSRPGGSFEIERALPNLPGADEVTVHAWGPRGVVCRAVATLPDFSS